MREQGKKLVKPLHLFPGECIKQLLSKGLTVAQIWRLLVQEKKICREVRGKMMCMSYETFKRKLLSSRKDLYERVVLRRAFEL